MTFVYDDDDYELWDFYDDNPEDEYPQFLIGINEEKLLELYEEVRKRTQK